MARRRISAAFLEAAALAALSVSAGLAEEPSPARDGHKLREEIRAFFQGAEVRCPGMPSNLAVEKKVAERFAASGFQHGHVEFPAMGYETGETTLALDGREAVRIWPMHSTLFRPGNFAANDFTAPLVYLGFGRYEDLEKLKGVELNGAIVLMEFNCGDAWQRFLRFGVKGFIFLAADDYPYGDAVAKVPRGEVALPRFFVDAANGRVLREAAGRKPPVTVRIRSEPFRWRDVNLRDLWVFIPGTDPALEREVCVIVAPVDSNGVVPDLAEGGQSGASLFMLLRLLDEFKRKPPERSVLLAAVNAHTQNFLGERMLAWHLLAPAVEVEKVRNTLANDIRYQELMLDTYGKINLEMVDKEAEDFLIRLRRLEDKSIGRNVILKTPIMARVKREVNQIKSAMLTVQRREKPSPERERELEDMRRKLDKYVHILTLFNKVGIRTKLSELTPDEVELLRTDVAGILAENREWVELNRRDLKTDTENGAIREVLAGRSVALVLTLDLTWGTDKIGFCSIDRHVENRNWSQRFGVNSTRIAAEAARAAGMEADNPFVDTMTYFRGLPQDYYFSSPESSIGYFSVPASTPALSLRNAFHDTGRAFTPGDTFDALDCGTAARLMDFLPVFFRAILEDKSITASAELPQPTMRSEAWSIQVRTFEFDPFSASVVPEVPVGGSIVLLHPWGGAGTFVNGDVIFCHSAITDNRASRIFYCLKERSIHLVSTTAYRLDRNFVVVDHVIDAGEVHAKVKSNLAPAASATLALFPCRETVIWERNDPSLISFTPIRRDSYIVIEGAQNASPRRYGLTGIQGLSEKTIPVSLGPAAIYLEERDRVKILTRELRLAINASETAPEGTGFDSGGEMGPDFFRAAVKDQAWLNQYRLKGLRGVSNQLVDDFLRRGAEMRKKLDAYLAARDYNAYLRTLYEALGSQVKAYEQISGIRNDMLKAVVFYMALLLPFCFFVQRLLFKSVRVEVQMATFMTLFVVTFVVFRAIHPAFRVARSPEAIFIAFVMGVLGLFVIWILHGRFEGEMQLIFSTYGVPDTSEIGYSKAGQEAMMMGVHNMKRRRVRTTLTTATIVLVTFTMLGFSSISRKMSPTIVPISKEARYTGIFYQWPGSLRMDEATLRSFLDLFSADADQVVVRRWLLPLKDASTGQVYPFAATSSAGRSIQVEAILGLPPVDADFLGPMPLLRGGRFFSSDSAREVILPARTAEALKLTPDDVGKVSLAFRGRSFTVVGIVHDERFHALTDLNNRPLIPIKQIQTMGGEESEAQASAKLEPGAAETGVFYADMGALLIMPAETARYLGAQPFSVSVRLKEGFPAWKAIDRVLVVTQAKFFVGSRSAFTMGEEGKRTTSPGVYYIGSGYKTSIGGLARLIIPLLIASTIILNTMLGSVYERKSEIAIYNAVGLNPTHIGLFFLAEAFVYSVIGSVGGYLIGQILSLTLVKFGWVQGINLNFSSLAVVYVILFTIVVVLLSTLYPAVVASRAAVPSGKRKWSMPPNDGQRMEVIFPFIYQAGLVPGVVAYLEEYFRGFTEASIGEMIVALERKTKDMDKEGRDTYELVYDVALAPYDLGVTQNVVFRASYDRVVQSYHITMVVTRVSGQDSNWVTTNKPFLERLRKHLMHWRNLSPDRRALYAQQASVLFGGGPADTT